MQDQPQDPRRLVPIPRIGRQTILVMGANREWLLCGGAIAAAMILFSHDWTISIVSAVCWFAWLQFLRRVAAADPYQIKILFRYFKYKNYYPSHSGPFFKAAPFSRNKKPSYSRTK